MQGLGGKSNVAEVIKLGEVVYHSHSFVAWPSEFALQVTHVLDLSP